MKSVYVDESTYDLAITAIETATPRAMLRGDLPRTFYRDILKWLSDNDRHLAPNLITETDVWDACVALGFLEDLERR